MVYADLHVHTRNSDGELALADLPAAATEAGVRVVGVTDHDRLHPGLDAPVTERDRITVVHGIELRVEAPGGQRVDLLAYGLEPTAALRTELDRLQRDRVERGRKIVECVEDRLGVDLDVPIRPGIGRPHIARAVSDHPETSFEDPDAVFEGLIGNGGPCFVARDVPSFADGVGLLRESSAIVGLAHPFRYGDPEAALDLCADLDAVERYYPYDRHDPVDMDLIDAAIDEYDLLATGGSDAHDHRLGQAGLSKAEYELITATLPPMS